MDKKPNLARPRLQRIGRNPHRTYGNVFLNLTLAADARDAEFGVRGAKVLKGWFFVCVTCTLLHHDVRHAKNLMTRLGSKKLGGSQSTKIGNVQTPHEPDHSKNADKIKRRKREGPRGEVRQTESVCEFARVFVLCVNRDR